MEYFAELDMCAMFHIDIYSMCEGECSSSLMCTLFVCLTIQVEDCDSVSTSTLGRDKRAYIVMVLPVSGQICRC